MPKAAATREVPKSIDIERAVLGALMLDNGLLDLVRDEGLAPADFYNPRHARVYAAMLALDDASTAFDVLILAEALEARGQLEQVGGRLFLSELLDDVYTTVNLREHVSLLRDKTIRRRSIELLRELTQGAYDETRSAAEYLQEAEQRIFELGEHHYAGGFTKAHDLIAPTFKEIEARYQRGSGITGLSSGYFEVDRLTDGFQRGNLVVLGARPSMGKTALALNLARNACAHKQRYTVGVFSLEMTSRELLQRVMAVQARIDLKRLRSGHLKQKEFPHLANAAAVISEMNLYIDDSTDMTVQQLRAKARRLKRETGLDLLIVDYLQLLDAAGRFDSNTNKVSFISRALKIIAKELDTPVLALSQLNREFEKRPGKNKRPILADLRESGSIEQDADVVLFLHRQEMFEADEQERQRVEGCAEVIIAKQRNGPTGKVILQFEATTTAFDNGADKQYRATEECAA